MDWTGPGNQELQEVAAKGVQKTANPATHAGGLSASKARYLLVQV